MSDKELIEFAAKAIGWRVASFSERGTSIVNGGMAVVVGEGRNFGWRPQLDDGDSMRLAVKLRMEIYHGSDEGSAAYVGYWVDGRMQYCIEYYDDITHMGDACSATRRAILRAAAEVGKAMQ